MFLKIFPKHNHHLSHSFPWHPLGLIPQSTWERINWNYRKQVFTLSALKEVSQYWQLKLASSSGSKHLHLVIAVCSHSPSSYPLADKRRRGWLLPLGVLTHCPRGKGVCKNWQALSFQDGAFIKIVLNSRYTIIRHPQPGSFISVEAWLRLSRKGQEQHISCLRT